jgi:hypothetical protein
VAGLNEAGHRAQSWDWALWRRWVGANSLAEMIGLGGSAALGTIFIPRMESVAGAIGGALVLILAGTFLEGVVVGWLQSAVLGRAWPALNRRAWIVATAVGAGAAWTLGMIPSTVMALAETEAAEAATATPEMPDALVYSLAFLMGLVLGPVLALPQWWLLRHRLARARWWVPANALAWGCGMVIIFVAAGRAFGEGGLFGILTSLLILALAGAVVGAIHGLGLIWLLAGPTGGR